LKKPIKLDQKKKYETSKGGGKKSLQAEGKEIQECSTKSQVDKKA